MTPRVPLRRQRLGGGGGGGGGRPAACAPCARRAPRRSRRRARASSRPAGGRRPAPGCPSRWAGWREGGWRAAQQGRKLWCWLWQSGDNSLTVTSDRMMKAALATSRCFQLPNGTNTGLRDRGLLEGCGIVRSRRFGAVIDRQGRRSEAAALAMGEGRCLRRAAAAHPRPAVRSHDSNCLRRRRCRRRPRRCRGVGIIRPLPNHLASISMA